MNHLVVDTYYGDLPTELVLDFASFSRIWTMLFNELVEVLDTHLQLGYDPER